MTQLGENMGFMVEKYRKIRLKEKIYRRQAYQGKLVSCKDTEKLKVMVMAMKRLRWE